MNSQYRQYIDHTLLSPVMTGDEAEQGAREAIDYGLYGICVPPFWVKKAKRILEDRPVKMITVAGFPLGYQMTEAKMEEIKQALKNGADEVDMVMNISAFKSGLMWTKVELAKCAQFIHEHKGLFKVIIETGLLEGDELERACMMASNAGADLIKTSTGSVPGTITPDTIERMRKVLPHSVGIKASGGIKTLDQIQSLVQAGVERIGTSSAIKIIENKSV